MEPDVPAQAGRLLSRFNTMNIGALENNVEESSSSFREPSSSISIVIPVYNEKRTLLASLERLLKADMPLEKEILVVDDGSTDEGLHTIAHLLETGEVRLVRHARNKGKGAAVRTGIHHATGDLLTIMDADLEYDPDDYRRLMAPLMEEGAPVVFGTRSFGAHTAYSFWFVVGNKFLSLWASFLFNGWLSDIETCFKIARTELWRGLCLKEDGFGMEAEVTAKLLKSGYPIHEVPIRYKARSRAAGKKLRVSDGIEALWILTKIRFFGRASLPRYAG